MLAGTQVVSAASISSRLVDSQTVSTSFNTDNSGLHEVKVSGYEQHTQLKTYLVYDVTNGTTGGGELSLTHKAHNGYKFIKKYNNVQLTSSVYLNKALISTTKVS